MYALSKKAAQKLFFILLCIISEQGRQLIIQFDTNLKFILTFLLNEHSFAC